MRWDKNFQWIWCQNIYLSRADNMPCRKTMFTCNYIILHYKLLKFLQFTTVIIYLLLYYIRYTYNIMNEKYYACTRILSNVRVSYLPTADGDQHYLMHTRKQKTPATYHIIILFRPRRCRCHTHHRLLIQLYHWFLKQTDKPWNYKELFGYQAPWSHASTLCTSICHSLTPPLYPSNLYIIIYR